MNLRLNYLGLVFLVLNHVRAWQHFQKKENRAFDKQSTKDGQL